MLRNHTIFNALVLIATLSIAIIANTTNATTHIVCSKHDTNITHIMQTAKQYLRQRIKNNKQHKKLTVVFDINKTTLSHLQQKRQTHLLTPPGIFHDASTYHNTQITPMLDFYKFAEKNKLTVFFITYDDQKTRQEVVKNLHLTCYKKFKWLYLEKHKIKSDKDLKNAIHEQLVKQGYDIALNINDNNDQNNFADKVIKIPKTFYSCQ